MAIVVELVDSAGHRRTGVADPSGGTFDAAGDFDHFLAGSESAGNSVPVLRDVDAFGDIDLDATQMPQLLIDIGRCLEVAAHGPGRRGLLRLRTLAVICADDPGSYLTCTGD